MFSTGAELLVVIPPPPAHWLSYFPDLRFTLDALDPREELCEVEVVDWRVPVPVRATRRANSPLLARPWSPAGAARGTLPAAGGLFPLSLRSAGPGGAAGTEGAAAGGALVLELSWQDGPAAALLGALWDAGVDVALLNAPRLVERMRGAADPWAWDIASVAERLAAGDFTAWDLDLLPCADVSVRTGEGEWFVESPFAAPQDAGPAGMVRLSALPYGIHSLFGPGGRRCSVFLDARGPVVVPPPLSPSARSGGFVTR